jgi:hypothetical protein
MSQSRSGARKYRSLFACTTAVLAATLATACSDSGSITTDGEGTLRAVINGQNVRVDAPIVGDNGSIAIWFHGQGGTVDTRMDEDWLNALRNDGWSVASGDLGGNAWGSQDGIDTTTDLFKWASAETGKPVTLLVAGSMGALNSLNTLARGKIEAPCWYGTMPVLDQTTVGNVPNAEAQLEHVFGPIVPEKFIPIAATLPVMKYRVLASPDDTWVPKALNADRLVEIIPSEAVLTQLAVSGEHGDPSHFTRADLAAFASTCLPN